MFVPLPADLAADIRKVQCQLFRLNIPLTRVSCNYRYAGAAGAQAGAETRSERDCRGNIESPAREGRNENSAARSVFIFPVESTYSACYNRLNGYTITAELFRSESE